MAGPHFVWLVIFGVLGFADGDPGHLDCAPDHVSRAALASRAFGHS